jgi:exopolysaccharide production protein ExoQ
VFGNVRWWIGLIALAGFVLQDAFGSALLYLSLFLVGGLVYTNTNGIKRGLHAGGLTPWLMPGIAVLSVLWSAEPLISLHLSLEMMLTVGIAVVISIENGPEECLLATLMAAMTACLLSLVIRHPYLDHMTNTVSNAGIFHQKNVLGSTGVLCMLAGLPIATHATARRSLRILGWFGFVLGMVTVLSARDVSGAAAGAVALSYFAVMWISTRLPARQRVAYLQVSFLVLLVCSLLAGVVIWNFGADLLRLVGKNPTLTGRTELWGFAREASAEHPLLGAGYQAFWVRGHPMAEFLWKKFQQPERDHFHFHNVFYFILTELGGVGIGLLCLYVVRVVFAAARWLRTSNGSAPIFHVAFIIYNFIYSQTEISMFLYFSASYAVLTMGHYHACVATKVVALTGAHAADVTRPQADVRRVAGRRRTGAIWHRPASVLTGQDVVL